jgi:ADP-heptose:LPS heptosyltransferase
MMEGVTLHSNIHSTLNLFSLEELKAAIQRLDLFTSADTGPLYIAEAFNVATVDIIGPIDEREQPPIGPRHKVVVAPRQRPQLSVMNARIYDVREARRQVDTITIPMVEAAIEELL